jgi:hypothetical protein
VAPEDLYIDGKFIKSNKDSTLQYSISSIVNSTGTTIVGSGVHRNDGRWERSASGRRWRHDGSGQHAL